MVSVFFTGVSPLSLPNHVCPRVTTKGTNVAPMPIRNQFVSFVMIWISWFFLSSSIPAPWSEGHSFGDPSNVARERPKRRLPESDNKRYERRSDDHNHSFCGWCDDLNQLIFFLPSIPAPLSEGHSLGDLSNVARERRKRRLPESDKKMYERRSNDNNHCFCGWCDGLNQLVFFFFCYICPFVRRAQSRGPKQRRFRKAQTTPVV